MCNSGNSAYQNSIRKIQVLNPNSDKEHLNKNFEMYGDRFGNGRSHDYTALQLDVQHSPSKVKDLHNRCCKGKYWCVKVSPLLF